MMKRSLSFRGIDLNRFFVPRLDRQAVAIDFAHVSRQPVFFGSLDKFRPRDLPDRHCSGLHLLSTLCTAEVKPENLQFFVTRNVHLAVGDNWNYIGIAVSGRPASRCRLEQQWKRVPLRRGLERVEPKARILAVRLHTRDRPYDRVAFAVGGNSGEESWVLDGIRHVP